MSIIIPHYSSTISFKRSVPAKAKRTGLIKMSLLDADIEESFFNKSFEAAGIERRHASVRVLY